MFNADDEKARQREAFVGSWRHAEKRIERYGGLLFILAGALVLAFDHPGDQLSAVSAATLIAAGLLFIFRSRRPAGDRTHLYFLSYQQQSSRAVAAGMGALFILYRGIQMNRPLLMIIAGILGAVAAWYQWRALQVQQYDRLFEKPLDNDSDAENA